LGLPGTGLFYTTTFPSRTHSRTSTKPKSFTTPVVRREDRLSLGFFKRLITPDDEEAFVDGCRELVLGNEDKALEHLRRAAHLADGAYLAGFLALKKGRLDEAAEYLLSASNRVKDLGRYFNKYGISATMSLPITDEVSAHVGPDLRGILLGLVEAYQRQRKWNEAIKCLERLHRLEPEDVVVKLSLAELLLEASPGDPNGLRKVAELAEGVKNDSEIHAALLLYQARALRRLKLHEASRKVLSQALRKKKDRSKELLLALRYERALVYEELGQNKRARSELEKIYAEAPDYEDVAERIGV
jgi:tetratricopeptide (TPR) repeat protein